MVLESSGTARIATRACYALSLKTKAGLSTTGRMEVEVGRRETQWYVMRITLPLPCTHTCTAAGRHRLSAPTTHHPGT
jgi:hypothetical protein